jgi:hypothetical protein
MFERKRWVTIEVHGVTMEVECHVAPGVDRRRDDWWREGRIMISRGDVGPLLRSWGRGDYEAMMERAERELRAELAR